jgi:predicted Zn-dependent protease
MEFSDFSLGESVYHEIQEAVIVDSQGWAVEQVQRVASKIQANDPVADRLVPKVIWISEATAFTLPGRYVYFSRELLQLLNEEATAFVFAHEIAHHRLGHVHSSGMGAPLLKKLPGGAMLGLLTHLGERVLFSPEHEMAADRWAFDRCQAVGYDLSRCLEFFRVIEKKFLDLGANSVIFGPDDPEQMYENEQPTKTQNGLQDLTRLTNKAKNWFWERRYGYKTLRERREVLERLLAAPRTR